MKRTCCIAVLLLLFALTSCKSTKVENTTPTASGSPTPASTPAQTETPAPNNKASYEITYSSATTTVNSIGTVWLQTIVEINNNGTVPLYLNTSSYDLEDAEGNLVAAQSLVSCYPEVIDPGEKGYMYEDTTLDGGTGGQSYTVIPHLEVSTAVVERIRLGVSDFTLSADEYSGLKFLGRVENTTDTAQSYVYVVAFLYDAQNKLIGIMYNVLTDEIAPGEKKGCEINSFGLPDNITVESVDHYDIVAYPSQIQF